MERPASETVLTEIFIEEFQPRDIGKFERQNRDKSILI